MKPWEISIKQPVFISMVMLALIVVGVIAYTGMPLDFFPDVSYPTMAILTIYPGAGPREVETQVTRPIEEAMVTASGVEEVQSRSSEGYSIVIVSFSLNKDDKVAIQEVREKLNNVRSELPDDIYEPTIRAYDPSSRPSCASRSKRRRTPPAGDAAVVIEICPGSGWTACRCGGDGRPQREIQVLLEPTPGPPGRAAGHRGHPAESYQHPSGSIEQSAEPGAARRATYRWDVPVGFDGAGRGAVATSRSCRMAGRSGIPTAPSPGGRDYFRRKQSGTNTVQVAAAEGCVGRDSGGAPDLNLTLVGSVCSSATASMMRLTIGAIAAC